MIFQEPMTSLNPVLPIGLQIIEPLQFHLGMSTRDANSALSNCCEWWVSPIPSSGCDNIRINFPVACGNA